MATGYDNGLCQDYCRKLHLWFASRLDARAVVRRWFGDQTKKGNQAMSQEQKLREALLTREEDTAPAPAVPQGWKLVPIEPTREIIEAICHAKNLTRNGLRAVMSDTELASIYRAMLATTPAPAPAQAEPFGYFRVEPFGWTDCAEDDEGAIALYERPQEVGLTDEGPSHVALLNEGIRSLDAEHEAREFFESENRDSYGFKRSVRGTYVNGAVARDWKWFQLGVHHATKDLP